MKTGVWLLMALCAWAGWSAIGAARLPAERTATFDTDPGWEGRNNRAVTPEKRTIRQDFGYSRTARAGGALGEIGGYITPAAEPAYYARKIARLTFNDALSASGRILCPDSSFHVLLGFFNANTVNEWRTPNSVCFRLLGRGDRFLPFVEYCTSKWRAGGDSPGGFKTIRDPESGRLNLAGIKAGEAHKWSIRYDPQGNQGGGQITVTIDDETAICNLDAGHKQDGAEFNRFGLLNVVKSADGGGGVWLDDVTINGETERFDTDPKWDALRNRESYVSAGIRPRFDFGYSKSRKAGGKDAGEIGGMIYRGDDRYPDKVACYGDKIGPLTFDKPITAVGRISLHRAVSDSSTLIGFYHSAESMALAKEQKSMLPRSFLGIAVEAPSRDGFFIQPACRSRADGGVTLLGPGGLYIYPNGSSHEWKLECVPDSQRTSANITVTLDGKSVKATVSLDQVTGTTFDRFGIVTTWIDGNGQTVYLDDLRYTASQD